MRIVVPDECEDWLTWISDAFEKLESSAPKSRLLEFGDDHPEWVIKMVGELITTLYPAAKLRRKPTWTPDELGAVLGQRIAYLQRLCEPDPWPGLDVERILQGMTDEERQRAEKWSDSFDEFALNLYELTAAALGLGLIQSHAESSAFMTAFARGLAMKPSDMYASNFQRTTTRIYWLLFRCWPSVGKLGSVRELHQALCRHFEPYVVGDQKRIEKMCQRLGLSFGEPGRPRKRKK